MTIEKAILSATEPKETNTAWAEPKGESIQLNIFNDGKWRPVAGASSTNQNVVTLTSEVTYNDLKTLYDAAIIEKGLNKTDEELSSMSEREYNAWRDECVYALKDTTFVSNRHGKSVNVLFDDTQNPSKINILYEDGYVVSYHDGYGTREIPPTMRYCYGRENMDEWLWDEFGERNVGVDNAHTLTTTLYEPDSGMVYNLVYVNPHPKSKTYPTYSRWATHYQYTSEGTTEDRVNYIILRSSPQFG